MSAIKSNIELDGLKITLIIPIITMIAKIVNKIFCKFIN